MTKKSLNETLKKRINKIISEELGINSKLDMEAAKAAKSIIANLNGKPFKKEQRENGEVILIRSHTENVELENKRVRIYATNYFFQTENEKNKFIKTHMILQGYSYDVNMIFVPIFTTKGHEIDMEDFIDTVYHELEHFFQTSLMGHDFGSGEVYTIAKKNLYSPDKIEQALSVIIYASTPSEQDAFINGMYGSLKDSSIAKIDDAIKDSEAYNWYKNLCESYILIKNSDIGENTFNKSQTWFLNVAKRGIKRYEKKLARAIYKLKSDIQIKEGYHHHFSSKHPLEPGQLFWLN